MARTPLFAALRRALIRAETRRRGVAAPPSSRPPSRPPSHPGPLPGPSRRAVLGGAGALALTPLLPACSDPEVREVAVVGGGIAGLHCAYRLAEAGADVTVYEASGRTGGRMFTRPAGFPDGHIVELGGELVDTGHATIRGLCTELGLALDDLDADGAGLIKDVFHFHGRAIPDEEIIAAFTPLAMRMQATVTAAEADDAEFERVDAMSISAWLEAEGLVAGSLLRDILEVAYTGEYGLDAAEQSIFNLLYLIDYDEPAPFRVFGDSDERFHVHAGSQAITDALAAALATRIELEHALVRLARSGSHHVLTFETATGERTVRAEHVVLAIPFTTLRLVDLADAGLSDEKRQVIDELGYGSNAKLMGGFSQRVWREIHGAAGSSFSDVGALQTTWDSSRGQPGDGGVLTDFVGGARGVAIGEGTAEARMAEVLPWLDVVFPGTAAAYRAGSAIRQHWPTAPFARGSYACYRPGQWAFYGTEGERAGNIHFCGEHTSLDFQGYMEGGAETGGLVAAQVIEDLGLTPPLALSRVIAASLRRPQVAFRGDGRRWRRNQRRAAARR